MKQRDFFIFIAIINALKGHYPAEFISNLIQHICLEVSSMPIKTLMSLFKYV